jgi:hypothetical protein
MINGRLIPFAVLALYALLTLSGQENPKQTNINASKRCEKFILRPLLFFIYEHILSPGKKITIF